jgi:hypothetical protein
VILLPALFLVLLVESFAALTLAATTAATRLRADRRWAIEAEFALETAMAEASVAHRAALALLPPGSGAALPVTAPSPWQATAHARRLGASPLVQVVVAVAWSPSGGPRFAGRRGTLLLTIVAADTALVIGERPRF